MYATFSLVSLRVNGPAEKGCRLLFLFLLSIPFGLSFTLSLALLIQSLLIQTRVSRHIEGESAVHLFPAVPSFHRGDSFTSLYRSTVLPRSFQESCLPQRFESDDVLVMGQMRQEMYMVDQTYERMSA